MVVAELLPDRKRRLFAYSLSCPQPAWPVKAGYEEGVRSFVELEPMSRIVYNNSPMLYQFSIDVEIARHGAYAIFLQSRRYTGLIALHEGLHRGSWIVGIAIK